jgi:hypothetical protein
MKVFSSGFLSVGVYALYAFWYVDPLLGNDQEISNYTTAVTRQRSVNSNRGKIFLCGPCRDVISKAS